MLGRYDNLLAGKDQTIRALWAALVIAVAAAIWMGLGWSLAPQQLRVHLPPDLSSGAVLTPGEVGSANVYTFALYIWQQLNRWEQDGDTDYPAKIHALQHYLTPSCQQNRLDDHRVRQARRELSDRARSVWELPGQGYRADRVYSDGPGHWVVTLDLALEESLLGEPIKQRAVRYPLRIVRYAVDPERNPFGLALDCLAAAPSVIDPAQRSAS